MTFTIETVDGTVVFVEERDLELFKAYLALTGYPPVHVEVTKSPASMPMQPSHGAS